MHGKTGEHHGLWVFFSKMRARVYVRTYVCMCVVIMIYQYNDFTQLKMHLFTEDLLLLIINVVQKLYTV